MIKKGVVGLTIWYFAAFGSSYNSSWSAWATVGPFSTLEQCEKIKKELKIDGAFSAPRTTSCWEVR